ncbi:MAG: desulfoferrodoxin family protein [bacterium]
MANIDTFILFSYVIKYKNMGAQKPKNSNDLSDFERTHVPSVEIPYQPMKGSIFELIVKVGEIFHDMEEEHFIQWIELYNGDVLLDRVELGSEVAPKCIFNVSFMENTCFRVIASCNLHGAWEKVVRVEFS